MGLNAIGLVKVTRGIRVVCATCGQTVASAGRRVQAEPDEIGEYIAARHAPPEETAPCTGSRRPAPRAPEDAAAPRAPELRPEGPELEVQRWNQHHPAGTAVAVRFVRGGMEYQSSTLSIAWLAAGYPVVAVIDRDGTFGLDLVRVLKSGETLPEMPRSSKRAGGAR
jgi:hypothetical protein